MSPINAQLSGKTITRVIARPNHGGGPAQVFMMAFDDGSVFEFVSPKARRALEKAAKSGMLPIQTEPEQLSLA